jgi:tryptophan-rich sensory protein
MYMHFPYTTPILSATFTYNQTNFKISQNHVKFFLIILSSLLNAYWQNIAIPVTAPPGAPVMLFLLQIQL